MEFIPYYLRRPAALLKIPQAIARGLTVEGFIRQLKASGMSYRRTLMLADFRSVSNTTAREGLLRYIRKTVFPSLRLIADVEWEKMTHEYMYRVKVFYREKPRGKLQEEFRNVMSNTPLTIEEIERTFEQRVSEKYDIETFRLVRVEAWSAFRRVSVETEGE